MRELKQVQWLRVAGIKRWVCYQWKAKGQCSKGDQCSFLHDINKRAKSTPKTTPSSEPPTQRGRSASRKGILRGRSPFGKSNRQPCKDFLKGICATFLCDNWHPPQSQNRVVHSAISGRFRTKRVRNNQIKSRKRVVTKLQWLYWQMCDSWVVHFKTQRRWNLYRFFGRAHKSWDQFDQYDLQKATQRHADIREN